MSLLRLGPSAAAKEKRLASLLEGRDVSGLGLAEAVRDAQLFGSLELAGETITLDEVRAARIGHPVRLSPSKRCSPGTGPSDWSRAPGSARAIDRASRGLPRRRRSSSRAAWGSCRNGSASRAAAS